MADRWTMAHREKLKGLLEKTQVTAKRDTGHNKLYPTVDADIKLKTKLILILNVIFRNRTGTYVRCR